MSTGSPLQLPDGRDIAAVLDEADSLRSVRTRRYRDALNAYDACVAQLECADDVKGRRALARAKLGQGACYFDLEKDDAARRSLEAFAAEPDDGDPFVADLHAQSLLLVGRKLVDRNMLPEAIAVFRTGLDRFAHHTDNAAHDTVTLLFFNLGSALTAEKRDQDALADYERLLTHLQTSTGPLAADETAEALWRKGLCLRRLARSDEAVRAWASAIDRFGGDGSCADIISEIRLSYADALIETGATAEAHKQCDVVIAAARSALGNMQYAFDDDGQYRKWTWMKRIQEAQGKLKDLSLGEPDPKSKT
jgi:tetratricopeptide (TPR) repeat protein